MKFKTFRLLVVGAGLALCSLGGVAFISFLNREGPSGPKLLPTDPTVHELPTGSGGDGAVSGAGAGTVRGDVGTTQTAGAPTQPSGGVASGGALRPMDRRILELVAGVRDAKVKDAFPGERWKVNVYRDEGFAKPNRVKLDLDRDERWDEKWTFDGDELKRQVSPSDDDATYSEEYRLAGDRWEPFGVAEAGGAIDTPAPEAAPAAGLPLRDLDRLILSKIGAGISGDKVKDAFSGQPWKASLYRDAGFAWVNRVKLDLDRDEKWDEKWTIEREGGRETVKRQVAPADDERYTEEYRLQGGAWVVKQP